MELRKEDIKEENEKIEGKEKNEDSFKKTNEEDIIHKNKSIKKEIIKENENKQNIDEEENKISEENFLGEIDLESTSTYILKYTRKGDELKEISVETGLRKSENCLFMLNIKLIKSDSVLTEKDAPQENSENYLVFCCHEIAAIYFDEIYERVYTLDDLIKENRHFRVLESTEEAKNIIDKTIRKNEKNDKKIFLSFKNNELKLHMKLKFFDEDKEIVLNIPKKILTDEDKINLLPEFLKEIQDKMNHLNEENKKMKIKKTKAYNNRIKEIKNNYRANTTFDFYINDNIKDEINKTNEIKLITDEISKIKSQPKLPNENIDKNSIKQRQSLPFNIKQQIINMEGNMFIPKTKNNLFIYNNYQKRNKLIIFTFEFLLILLIKLLFSLKTLLKK